MSKTNLLLISFLIILIPTRIFANECFYSQSYKFDDRLLLPSSVIHIKINNVLVEEFSFHTSLDEGVAIFSQLPAVFMHDYHNVLTKIREKKNITMHHYEKKILKNDLTILEYTHNEFTTSKILFVFNSKNNNHLGSIVVSNNRNILDSIINSLYLNTNIACSKKLLWDQYKSLSRMELNTRLKVLFSLYSIDSKDSKINAEIINLLANNKKLVDLQILNFTKNLELN